MNTKSNNLLCLIFVLLCIFVPLYMYNGSIDDYASKHIAVSLKTMSEGSLQFSNDEYGYLTTQIPEYYIFLAELLLISNIQYDHLVFTPVLLIPYVIVVFSLFYLISKKNVLLSIFITFIIITSGVNGTHRVFIWPHGIGEIIFFSFLLILGLILKEDHKKYEYSILLLLLSISVQYISYNVSYLLIGFIFWFTLLGTIYIPSLKKINFGNLLIISLISYLGLNQFIYKTFLPLVKNEYIMFENGLYVSFIEKFFKNYFGISQNDIFDPYYVTYPSSLTIIYVLKYLTIFLVLSVVLCRILKRVNNLKSIKIDNMDLIFLLFFVTTILYVLPRMILGQIAITEFFYPFLISIPLLYNMYSKKLDINPAYIVIIIMILTNFTSFYIISQNHLVQNDENYYGYLKDNVYWFEKYVPNNSSIKSDQLTHGFYLTHKTYYENTNTYHNNLYFGTYLMDHLRAIYFQDQMTNREFLALNSRLPYIQTAGWKILKSYNAMKHKIDENSNLVKIYTSSGVSVYYNVRS